MSESALPNDPNQWPIDPYELLGVERTADARELRRAYTRLIRVFKPEQFPEQFRRIREAYEFADRFASFLFVETPEPATTPTAANEEVLQETAITGDVESRSLPAEQPARARAL